MTKTLSVPVTAKDTGVSRIWTLVDDASTIAQIVAPNYLYDEQQAGHVFSQNDVIVIKYPSDTGLFSVAIDGSNVITLTSMTGSAGGASVVGRIAHFSSTEGDISGDPAAITNLGDVLAGQSGTAGKFTSFPGTAAKGTLSLQAANSTANYNTVITNGTMNRNVTFVIPDPGVSASAVYVSPSTITSGCVLTTNGVNGVAGTYTTGFRAQFIGAAGGAGANVVLVDANIHAASLVMVQLETSANAVTIQKTTVSEGSVAVTMSGEPGAATYKYIVVATQ